MIIMNSSLDSFVMCKFVCGLRVHVYVCMWTQGAHVYVYGLRVLVCVYM